jgi:glycosyltransferase involved in cell wall biosynthesis
MTVDADGGVLTYALTLADELTRRGAEVDLASMGSPLRPDQRAAARGLRGVTLHESTFALEWMEQPWSDVARAGEWLLGLERSRSPDVIHLNGYCHAAIGFAAPVLVVAHSCVLSWWDAVVGGPLPPSFERYAIEVTRGIGAARAVATPSAAMRSSLTRHYGAPADVTVVPNGAPPPERAVAANAKRKSTILAAGRLWDRAKNVAMVARVAGTVTGTVRVAGCSRAPRGEDCALEGVEALGWLDAASLGREMEAAAVFVHPARYEPFGLAPLEAALRGCALVLGDIPSLREVWGDAATFVDPDDDVALARALQAYLDDGELRAEHAERARARAATFTPQRMADGTLDLYTRLLATRARVSPAGLENGASRSCA